MEDKKMKERMGKERKKMNGRLEEKVKDEKKGSEGLERKE